MDFEFFKSFLDMRYDHMTLICMSAFDIWFDVRVKWRPSIFFNHLCEACIYVHERINFIFNFFERLNNSTSDDDRFCWWIQIFLNFEISNKIVWSWYNLKIYIFERIQIFLVVLRVNIRIVFILIDLWCSYSS